MRLGSNPAPEVGTKGRISRFPCFQTFRAVLLSFCCMSAAPILNKGSVSVTTWESYYIGRSQGRKVTMVDTAIKDMRDKATLLRLAFAPPIVRRGNIAQIS